MINQTIAFFVPGEPRAKQSFRASKTGRGGFTPAYIKAWQSDVGWEGQKRMRDLGFMEPLEACAFTVTLTFFLGDARRIDLDNLSKAVQDGLNDIVWKDDQQNIRLVLEKYICRQRQGVLVQIEPNNRPLEIDLEEMQVMILATELEMVL